jgi:hypothetical protein
VFLLAILFDVLEADWLEMHVKDNGPLAWMIGLSAWTVGASASPGWMEIS